MFMPDVYALALLGTLIGGLLLVWRDALRLEAVVVLLVLAMGSNIGQMAMDTRTPIKLFALIDVMAIAYFSTVYFTHGRERALFARHISLLAFTALLIHLVFEWRDWPPMYWYITALNALVYASLFAVVGRPIIKWIGRALDDHVYDSFAGGMHRFRSVRDHHNDTHTT